MKKMLVCLLIGGWSLGVFATDLFWRDAVSVGNWDDPNNWSTNSTSDPIAVPGVSDTAFIFRQQISQTMLGLNSEWTVGKLTILSDRNTTTFDFTNCVLHSLDGFSIVGTGWTPGPRLVINNGKFDANGKDFYVGANRYYPSVTVELTGPGAEITNAIINMSTGSDETLIVSNGAKILSSQFLGYGGTVNSVSNTVIITGTNTVMSAPSLEEVTSPSFRIGDLSTDITFTVSDGAQLILPDKFPSERFRIGGVQTRFLVNHAVVTNIGGYNAINGTECEMRIENEGAAYINGADGYFWISGSDNQVLIDRSLFYRTWVVANISWYALSIGRNIGDTGNRFILQNNSLLQDTDGYLCVGYDGSTNELAVSDSTILSENGTVCIGFTTNSINNLATFNNGVLKTKAFNVVSQNQLAISGSNTLILATNITFQGGSALTFTIPAEGYRQAPVQAINSLTFGAGETTIRVEADEAFSRAGGGWVTLATSGNAITYAGSFNWILPTGAKVDLTNAKLIRVYLPSAKKWVLQLI